MSVSLRQIPIKRYDVPVLTVKAAGMHVVSVPTQIGCPVKCTFCVSSLKKFERNLTADEIVQLVVQSAPVDEPFLLAFTGEGDVLGNVPNVNEALQKLYDLGLPIGGLRFSVSGFAMGRIYVLHTYHYPTELQISLHTVNQDLREVMIPKSYDLVQMEQVVRATEDRWSNIRINYVLQANLNDREEDIQMLAAWGNESWSIILSPYLTANGAIVHPRVDAIADQLRDAGRTVHVFKSVGQELCDADIYTNLTYKTR